LWYNVCMTTTPVPDLPPDRPDQPQDKIALRRNKTAAWVRKTFPRGTRVEATAAFDQPGNGIIGTVIRHVPSMTADGGRLAVLWDGPNPHTGKSPWISDRMWAGGLLVVDPETGRGIVRPSVAEHLRDRRSHR